MRTIERDGHGCDPGIGRLRRLMSAAGRVCENCCSMSSWPSTTMHALTWGRPILSALLRVHIPPASEGGFAPSDFDVIEDHPEATALRVEGLDQDSFEMLVDRYGERFSALGLWKCPRIEDLTPLETMTKLTHVVVFWNQRATRLWNLTATPALTGLHLTDFKRLRSLDDLADGRGLEELEIGDMPGSSGFVVESLEPLANLTELRFLSLVVRVADGRVQPLGALQRLKLLRSPINRWTTDQCAWLRAHLPADCEGRVLQAIEQRENPSGDRGVRIVGKRKPSLSATDDAHRIARYVAQYDELVTRFRSDPSLDP